MRRKPKRFKSRRSWFRKQNSGPQRPRRKTDLASDGMFRRAARKSPWKVKIIGAIRKLPSEWLMKAIPIHGHDCKPTWKSACGGPVATVFMPAATVIYANLRGFDDLLEAAPSVFNIFLRVVEALEHSFVTFGAEFLTAIDSVFDDFGHAVYPILHLFADIFLKIIDASDGLPCKLLDVLPGPNAALRRIQKSDSRSHHCTRKQKPCRLFYIDPCHV